MAAVGMLTTKDPLQVARDAHFGNSRPTSPTSTLGSRQMVFSYASPETVQQAKVEAMHHMMQQQLKAAAKAREENERLHYEYHDSPLDVSKQEQAPESPNNRVPGSLDQCKALVMPPEIAKSGDERNNTSKVIVDGKRKEFQRSKVEGAVSQAIDIEFLADGVEGSSSLHGPPSPGASGGLATHKSTKSLSSTKSGGPAASTIRPATAAAASASTSAPLNASAALAATATQQPANAQAGQPAAAPVMDLAAYVAAGAEAAKPSARVLKTLQKSVAKVPFVPVRVTPDGLPPRALSSAAQNFDDVFSQVHGQLLLRTKPRLAPQPRQSSTGGHGPSMSGVRQSMPGGTLYQLSHAGQSRNLGVREPRDGSQPSTSGTSDRGPSASGHRSGGGFGSKEEHIPMVLVDEEDLLLKARMERAAQEAREAAAAAHHHGGHHYGGTLSKRLSTGSAGTRSGGSDTGEQTLRGRSSLAASVVSTGPGGSSSGLQGRASIVSVSAAGATGRVSPGNDGKDAAGELKSRPSASAPSAVKQGGAQSDTAAAGGEGAAGGKHVRHQRPSTAPLRRPERSSSPPGSASGMSHTSPAPGSSDVQPQHRARSAARTTSMASSKASGGIAGGTFGGQRHASAPRRPFSAAPTAAAARQSTGSGAQLGSGDDAGSAKASALDALFASGAGALNKFTPINRDQRVAYQMATSVIPTTKTTARVRSGILFEMTSSHAELFGRTQTVADIQAAALARAQDSLQERVLQHVVQGAQHSGVVPPEPDAEDGEGEGSALNATVTASTTRGKSMMGAQDAAMLLNPELRQEMYGTQGPPPPPPPRRPMSALPAYRNGSTLGQTRPMSASPTATLESFGATVRLHPPHVVQLMSGTGVPSKRMRPPSAGSWAGRPMQLMVDQEYQDVALETAWER